jgi:hypothetical protein
VLLAAAALYFPLLTAVFVALPRYRLPFDVIVLVIVGGVFGTMFEGRARASSRAVGGRYETPS